MGWNGISRGGILLGAVLVLSGCGGGFGFGNFLSGGERSRAEVAEIQERDRAQAGGMVGQSTIWDLFSNAQPPSTTVEVNKYLWNASLEVLDFLPVQSIDPFSGVIVTGYGTPPGGGRAYRAAVLVNDPALDARSLNVAIMTRNGPASRDTIRAVEDAILTRARQLRIRDRNL
ncbi:MULTISPECIES: DUF3576 domain-containing protein [Roseinatronobacter]|uniref:DUF3576 domain-containing protein n=1 Tax=Roseinatronobacter domitianus TaxID=2940293 RepID=A0ABT0LYV4_9RHOB|nr:MULTISPECIES: DUF3576 domain-containing protein [Roseibaca]MCL1627785.1 DUF3576 domain-containing protein [Roseibaca domitiana]